jgi:hypothetical protein
VKNNCELSNQIILKIKKNNTLTYNNTDFENKNSCKLFNLKSNEIILNKLEINDKQLKILKHYEKKEKKWAHYLLYYIFPLCLFQKLKNYKIYSIYLDVFHKFLSIDFLIPMILNSYQSIKGEIYYKSL